MVLSLLAPMSTSIDSCVFRLHYRWTSAICFIACALVVASIFITGPITCTSHGAGAENLINIYCWITSTFTLGSRVVNTDEVPHPGSFRDESERPKIFQSYYYWVYIVLFIQGCLFYLPHLLWKANENKMVDSLLQGLNHNSIGDDVDAKKDKVIKYLKVSAGQNWKYSVVYLIFEVINFVNVIGQMFMLDRFFGGQFMDYGTKVINFAALDADDGWQPDPMLATFPRMSKCLFTKFGSSGHIEQYDVMCILPQNVLNEKIFLFMWFWFVVLATITAAYVVWLVVLMASTEVRVQCMMFHGGEISAVPGVEDSIRRLHHGDFFLLYILKQNVDVLVFRDIVAGLVRSPLDKDEEFGNR